VIVPSIDLQDGQTVQLVQGAAKALDAGDPRPIAQRFALVGEVAVIDLDAAMGRGSNEALIRDLLPLARCRVGGGIRDADTAKRWLDAGAAKVILGTAATPEILKLLPRERVIAALDSRDGDVVVEGWQKSTGRTVIDRIHELRDDVGGFLVTFVEIEGTLSGLDASRVQPIIEAAGPGCRVTAAGGITTAAEVGALDALGADAQVGMALYTGRMELAQAFAAPLRSDRADGLWPTVVVDESGVALGLVYSSAESLAAAIREGRGVYHSRTRGLWRKGETSGDVQQLLRVDVDCDRDALRFTVRQRGKGFCHNGTRTCWGLGAGLPALAQRLAAIASDGAQPGSYTARLLADHNLLNAKIMEEAGELASAGGLDHIVHEAADVVYFSLVRLIAAGGTLADLERELDARAGRISRRPGDAKPANPATTPGPNTRTPGAML
jgi:phosphoribosyl-ATP pyrophosphohydrolase/phosphoribosyl-AMP cyclohydrolase